MHKMHIHTCTCTSWVHLFVRAVAAHLCYFCCLGVTCCSCWRNMQAALPAASHRGRENHHAYKTNGKLHAGKLTSQLKG